MSEVHRLFVTSIETIGFVGMGDDPEAEIVFFKRKHTHDLDKRIVERDGKFVVMDAAGKKVLGTHPTRAKAEAQLRAIEKGDGVLSKILKAIGWKPGMKEEEVDKLLGDEAAPGSQKKGDGPMDLDMSKLTEEQQAVFDAAVAEGIEKAAEKKEEPDELKDLPEPLQKALEEMKASVEKSDQRAQAAEKEVEKMTDARTAEVYIRKAHALQLPGSEPDDFAAVLRQAEVGMTEEQVEKLNEVLTGASNMIKQSALGVLGRDAHGTTSAEIEIESIAKKYREDDPKLTKQLARAKAWNDHPELYAKHRQETVTLQGED